MKHKKSSNAGSNFTIQRYDYQVRERSWLDCQENNNSPSAYYLKTEEAYRILYNDKVILDGISSKYRAKELLINYRSDIYEKDPAKRIKKRFRDRINKLQQSFDKELKQWSKAKANRRNKILLGKSIQKYEDLSEMLSSYHKLKEILEKR